MKNKINRVMHFEVQADDIKRAKEFYEKVFNWKIEMMMAKENGGMDYWGLTTGPAGIPGINGGMYQRTKEKYEIPNVGWFAMAEDTEGNCFGIMQPTSWKPK